MPHSLPDSKNDFSLMTRPRKRRLLLFLRLLVIALFVMLAAIPGILFLSVIRPTMMKYSLPVRLAVPYENRVTDCVMSLRIPIVFFSLALFCGQCRTASAEDTRSQYPAFLANSYIGVQIGYMDYHFSNAQLQPPFTADSIQVPHLGVRALLFGHEFSKYLSVQITDMRPVEWVHYQNVSADGASHSVWMNVAGITAKPRLPLSKILSIYGEGGIGIVTRKGFYLGPTPALTDANYTTLLFGGGLQYRLNANWDLTAGVTMSPHHSAANQPGTWMVSGGFHYTMRPLPPEEVQQNSSEDWIFPKNILQAGYTSARFGYGVNDFVSKGAVPVFWAADVRVAHGFSLNYQHNVFHTRRVFSFDWGTGVGGWASKGSDQQFFTASFYPVLRFTALRRRPLDLYFNYSLAGPTFISKTVIDDNETGRRFTFQDFMGAGIFAGRRRHLNAEVRISHYSNGNLFPRNAGLTVPLTFTVGYAF
jgi:opacity protein-like surface antigen